jgi:hypothetical protein
MNIQEELKTIGTFPSFYGPMAGTPKYNTPVTPLENVKLALKRGADGNLKGEQIWAPQGGDVLTYCPKIIPDNISRGFVIETNAIDNNTQAGGPDMFNVEWEWVPAVGGSMVRPGTKQLLDDPDDLLEWEKFVKFPDIDSWDWEGSAAANKEALAAGERAAMPWVMTGYFERLISFMEFQNAAIALIDEEAQDAINRLFDKLTDLYIKMFEYYKKYYGATIVYFHDDWGSQQKAFLKYETYDEMIVPHLKRLCDAAHAMDINVVLHSCGKIENLVPLMVKAHVDVWSGQAMNDRLRVVNENKGKIYVEFGPDVGGYGMAPASEEEQAKLIDDWLGTFGPYLDTIFVNTSFGGNALLYKKIYEYSRNYFNR